LAKFSQKNAQNHDQFISLITSPVVPLCIILTGSTIFPRQRILLWKNALGTGSSFWMPMNIWNRQKAATLDQFLPIVTGLYSLQNTKNLLFLHHIASGISFKEFEQKILSYFTEEERAFVFHK
jgi:hypothetical protein